MKFFAGIKNLSAVERKLIPEVFVHLLASRMAVSFLPSRRYLPANATKPSSRLHYQQLETVGHVARVINGLSWRLPFSATCLVKALAAHRVLKKRNISHAIHFGIEKDHHKGINAHAWFSVEGKTIIGGGNLSKYHEISRIDIVF